MPAIFAVAAGLITRTALSGAALIGSIGFLKSKSGTPAPPKSGLSAFEAGTLVLYALGLLLTYKLVKEVVGK